MIKREQKIKICIITCYKQPDYIRARTLRRSLKAINDVELIVVKNSHKNILRYIEVIVETIRVRIRHHPDIYILTFRGYEMLIPIRLITYGKKLVFDEFINLIEWIVYEHHKIKKGGVVEKILKKFYRFWLKTADIVLSDTPSHADLSAEIMKLPRSRYESLIVSTDEQVFESQISSRVPTSSTFRVFYYGSMLPLHGVDIVLSAAETLANKRIEFILIGGNKATLEAVEYARNKGADIIYKSWVEFEQLPEYIQNANICLAGPFGNTLQAQYVITGKAYQFLQMGRPTIIGKNRETHIFTDKKDALIVDQSDVESLVEAIEWAYDNQSKLPAIGKAGHDLYQHKLSNITLNRQVERLLAKL